MDTAIYIARDSDGSLRLFGAKPHLGTAGKMWFLPEEEDDYISVIPDYMYLPESWYPEVTFENSPIKIELNLEKDE